MNYVKSMLWAGVLAAAPVFVHAAVPAPQEMSSSLLAQKVRHELVLLPFANLFDNLAFRLDGDRVTLLGQVRRPSLKKDAERAVRRIEGVSAVDNRIEVLPLSNFDDRIRLGVYRAIYGQDALFRYNLVPLAPIRIIVKNGDVTLEGVVASEMDKHLANIAANGVFGVFSVTNNLKVSKA
jgi:hyperosmotically inducible protein